MGKKSPKRDGKYYICPDCGNFTPHATIPHQRCWTCQKKVNELGNKIRGHESWIKYKEERNISIGAT